MSSSEMQTTLKRKKRIRKTIFVLGSLLTLFLGLGCPLFQLRASAVWSSDEAVREDADFFGGPPQSIAFQSNRDGNFEIYVMNPDGTDQTRLTFDSRSDIRPDVSPNGQQIVFNTNRITDTNPEGDFELFLMNSDGSDVRQLTFNTAVDLWPRWSPNGKQIAFQSFQSFADGGFEIWIINADGTGLTRVTNYPGVEQFPEWSPDGKRLVIRRDFDIYVINTDGSNPVQLTTAPGLDQMATWSPDGKEIAFTSFREGYCSVFVMDSDGSNQVNLTPKPDAVPPGEWCSRAPAWWRNGQHIYFTSLRPGSDGEDIYVMNADGTDVIRLTFSPGNDAEAAVR